MTPARLSIRRAGAYTLRADALSTLANVRHSSTGPLTVFDRSLWRSVVPKAFRRENRDSVRAVRTREWNPATFFIVMFLFIGSMSIQMIALRNSFERHMRQTSFRIATLREVVERIQKGEAVDVEKTLGTGIPEQEADWEEVLRAIEKEDDLRKPQRKGRGKKPVESKDSTTAADTTPPSPLSVGQDAAKPEGSKATFASFF